MKRTSSILLATLLLPAAVMAGQTVSGPATVVDGSTLAVDGVTFHLADAVAPGREQICRREGADWPCGQAAAAKLVELIAGRTVKCDDLGRDFDRQPLGVCYAGDEELNRDMIAAGMALVHWQVGLDYAEVQSVAKAAHLGLWSASFDDPWDWRRKHEAAASAPHS
jgi:endonuclease YncB( thermonuclease family)